MTPAVPMDRGSPGERFMTAEWDGECVVFDRWTGATHAFDELTSAIWRQPASQWQVDTLIEVLKIDFSDISLDILKSAIQDRLKKLDAVAQL